MVKLAQDADVLVYMCPYYSGTERSKEYAKGAAGHLEIARMAKEAKAKSLIITHVLPQIDKPGMREKVLREIGAIYNGNIYYGEDLMEIPIGDPMVKSHEK